MSDREKTVSQIASSSSARSGKGGLHSRLHEPLRSRRTSRPAGILGSVPVSLNKSRRPPSHERANREAPWGEYQDPRPERPDRRCRIIYGGGYLARGGGDIRILGRQGLFVCLSVYLSVYPFRRPGLGLSSARLGADWRLAPFRRSGHYETT